MDVCLSSVKILSLDKGEDFIVDVIGLEWLIVTILGRSFITEELTREVIDIKNSVTNRLEVVGKDSVLKEDFIRGNFTVNQIVVFSDKVKVIVTIQCFALPTISVVVSTLESNGCVMDQWDIFLRYNLKIRELFVTRDMVQRRYGIFPLINREL